MARHSSVFMFACRELQSDACRDLIGRLRLVRFPRKILYDNKVSKIIKFAKWNTLVTINKIKRVKDEQVYYMDAFRNESFMNWVTEWVAFRSTLFISPIWFAFVLQILGYGFLSFRSVRAFVLKCQQISRWDVESGLRFFLTLLSGQRYFTKN